MGGGPVAGPEVFCLELTHHNNAVSEIVCLH